MLRMLKIFAFLIIAVAYMSIASATYGEEDIRTNTMLTTKQINEIVDRTPPLKSDSIWKSENYGVLATYGNIPEKQKGVESYEWQLSISNVSELIFKNDALDEYLYRNNGFIIGYGSVIDGYIVVMTYDELEDTITDEDLKNIHKIINKYAEEKKIENVPIKIISSEMGEPLKPKLEFADDTQNSKAIDDDYESKVRPLIGGIQVYSDYTGPGTSGYAVVSDNNSSEKGFVTSAHLVDFDNYSVYQPTNDFLNLNQVGTSAVSYTNVDAIYIPMSDVDAELHIGNGETIAVGGYTDSSGIDVYRSGVTTGLTVGQYYGRIYDYEMSGGNLLDRVGFMEGPVAQAGDSGGPLYSTMDIAVGHRAFVLGITQGTYSGNATGYETMTVFVPFREIKDKLGVSPLTK
ncbi:hypothetical protein [Methanolapillus ohkumae]|uniref:Uncharacterized protein n=1 Tax=Methanolapillus ohkumae TaxID=3028298 RepID=A0AA96V4D0_9EURY|nr:hypothetical protein MsAm2_00690 [Methanosarcinaceae archaeon Am2]